MTTSTSTAERDAIIRDAFDLCDRVAAWKPGKLAAKPAKPAPLTHARNPGSRNGTMCGRSVSGMNGRVVSRVSDSPTCPACLARLAGA